MPTEAPAKPKFQSPLAVHPKEQRFQDQNLLCLHGFLARIPIENLKSRPTRSPNIRSGSGKRGGMLPEIATGKSPRFLLRTESHPSKSWFIPRTRLRHGIRVTERAAGNVTKNSDPRQKTPGPNEEVQSELRTTKVFQTAQIAAKKSDRCEAFDTEGQKPNFTSSPNRER